MTTPQIKAYLSAIGRKGGSAGRGDAKRRGDSAHYRAMAARRRKKSQNKS
jgi:hypothetical protein